MQKDSCKNLRVIDFFCGAGGFSEGFRQQGFRIVQGIDCWQTAIDTHNLNHGLRDSVKNVLDFWGENSADVDEIEQLEDTEFLIGSPSCVSFSMSNRAGKADKDRGIQLVEAYLRVVAVKKHKKTSVLKAWYMENVPKSRNFVRKEYTFKQLNLAKWAKVNQFRVNDIALRVDGEMLDAGDYGAAQERIRFIAGEWVPSQSFIAPLKTHRTHHTVADIKEKMPRPNQYNIKALHLNGNSRHIDPNYPALQLRAKKLTDHFYDTGVYKIDWENAEFLKTNHPYMGKMSFPENNNKPSRTIMATRSPSTREALLYHSEYNRRGNGQYRLPTIREAASLMGFPYTYQFKGSENAKWRQIGNSVCPHQSAALAKALREEMGLKPIPDDKICFYHLANNCSKIKNLNTFTEKIFDSPRKRQQGARFRRHALKIGNMTIDLMNYHPNKLNLNPPTLNWCVTAFFGSGSGYQYTLLSNKDKGRLRDELKRSFEYLEDYEEQIRKLGVQADTLQAIYEEDLHLKRKDNPIAYLKKLATIIASYPAHHLSVKTQCISDKETVPLAQIMSAYGLLIALDN